MKNLTSKSSADISFVKSSVTIKLFGLVKIRTLDQIVTKINDAQKEATFEIINTILDLSGVQWISPAAVIGLVSVISALVTGKMAENNYPLRTFLILPPEHVLSYLVTLGFFTQMSNRANLVEVDDMIELEIRRRKIFKQKHDFSAFENETNEKNEPILLPLTVIPQKDDTHLDEFEYACSEFINCVRDTYDKLFLSSHFQFNRGNLIEFYSANGELFINIFEHSGSWGLCLIHANPSYGTIVCFHDIGKGIKGSFNLSPKVNVEFQKFETDCEAIRWATIEGNSSKVDGNGRGLTVVEEFVSQVGGTIEIRSGNCLLQKKMNIHEKKNGWNEISVPWLPGTQINFFVPCLNPIKEKKYERI